ncbi:DUF881 domain-containing protein [Kineococcus gynurae]|uniref:DUF881 domain-containing protein n=1 Tax=Kineococcus gynurae TaxID=452979 RepID=A0ABV5LXK3_9ACTN
MSEVPRRDAEAPAPAPAPAGPRGPWRRLWRAARPRATRAQILAGILCAALGLGVVVQVRQTRVSGLDDLREADLVRILDDTSERSDRLAAEVQQLEATRRELTAGSDSAEAAARAAADRARTYGLLAGTLPAAGPGITATVTDPAGTISPTVMIQAVQELRDAGAEALQINGTRVVASTAFTSPGPGAPAGGGVDVGGTIESSPFTILAIGDPTTLSTALDIPGGVRETLRQLGADLSVENSEDLRVTALHVVSAPQYARPATSG